MSSITKFSSAFLMNQLCFKYNKSGLCIHVIVHATVAPLWLCPDLPFVSSQEHIESYGKRSMQICNIMLLTLLAKFKHGVLC